MIRKKVKHIYFKSFIDNADIINTHNYFTSYSEFFIVKNFLGFYFVRTKNFMGIQRELCPLKDMEQGKVKLIWQDTKKEIPLSRIPYEENAK